MSFSLNHDVQKLEALVGRMKSHRDRLTTRPLTPADKALLNSIRGVARTLDFIIGDL